MVTAGRTPWWRQRQRERFARAVEPSPETGQAHDPKLAGELAVVMMLQRSAAATAPDRDARARMRAKVLAQLVADNTARRVAERAGAESWPPDFEPDTDGSPARKPSPVPRTKPGPTSKPSPTPRPKPAPPTKPAQRRKRLSTTRGRVAISLAAAFCLLLVLSGMTLLLSSNALPGDPLYGVRRTVEAATLGLTSGDEAKGLKSLTYGADVVTSIQDLAARYPDLKDSPVGDYLTGFADFDSYARSGTADLTSYATSNNDGVLSTLDDWATQQASRIQQVQPSLPSKAELKAEDSMALLRRIIQRADAISARDSCYTITSGTPDDLGVMPAGGPCDRPPTVGSPVNTSGLPGAGGTIAGQASPTPAVTPTQQPPAPGVAPSATAFQSVATPPAPTRAQGQRNATKLIPTTTLTIPLPLPPINLPGLLPGLPGLQIGQ